MIRIIGITISILAIINKSKRTVIVGVLNFPDVLQQYTKHERILLSFGDIDLDDFADVRDLIVGGVEMKYVQCPTKSIARYNYDTKN